MKTVVGWGLTAGVYFFIVKLMPDFNLSSTNASSADTSSTHSPSTNSSSPDLPSTPLPPTEPPLTASPSTNLTSTQTGGTKEIAGAPLTPPFVPPSMPSSVSSSGAKKDSRGGSKLLLGLFLALVFIPLGIVLGNQLKKLSLPGDFQTRVSPSPSLSVQKAEFKIGGILPLTGDAASYGIPLQQAALLAQKEINAQGGIGGRPIKFIWKDGRCEKNEAKMAAEQLVNQEKIDLLLGGACSSEFLNAAPLAQAKKIITFSSSATSPKISELGRYVFRTCPSDALAGKAAAGYAFEKWGAKTAAVVAEEKDYTLSLKEVFKENFSKLGGKVVLDEVFATGTTDFASTSAKIKNLAPEVVYILPQSPTPGVLLVKALKAQGVTAKILTAEVLLIRDAVTEQGQVLEGVTGIEVLFDENRPKTKKFLELYKNEYQLEPTYPGFMSGMYDILYLVKEAYESGAKNSDEMANWLYQLKNWEGAVGTLDFDEHGDPSMAYSIRQISNFSAKQVDTYMPVP